VESAGKKGGPEIECGEGNMREKGQDGISRKRPNEDNRGTKTGYMRQKGRITQNNNNGVD